MSTGIKNLKIIWLFLVGLICYTTFFAANIYMIHHLSKADFGDFAVSLKALAVMCTLLTVAKQLSLNIYIPQYEKSHKFIQKSGILKWLSHNLIVTAIVLAVGALSTHFVLYLMNNEPFIQAFSEHPSQFFMFFLPILTFTIVLSCLALSQENIHKTLRPIITIIPGILTIIVFLLGLYTLNISAIAIISVYVVCQISTLLLYLLLSKNFYQPSISTTQLTSDHDEWFSQSNVYWVSTISSQTSVVLSLVALELLSSESLVGEYAAILVFVIAYVALISPLHTYISSQINMVLHKNTPQLNKMLSVTNRYQIVIVIIINLTVIAYGPQILNYFGPTYLFLYPNLIIAMILFGGSIMTALPIRVLIHSEYQGTAYKLKIIRLFITLLLFSVFIPKYGVTGAIISDTIPSLITHIIAAMICRKQLNIKALPLI